MFLANKAGCAGITFRLLMTGMLVLGFPRSAIGADSNKEAVAAAQRNEIMKMQETLRDKGHYRGKVDGVFGPGTRASIRGFQRAENLPGTGLLDSQTAGRLGVRPEGGEEALNLTTKDKPSAGIKRDKGSARTSKPLTHI
jgi:peptidoglycan hydrolase-like protein with peptidoglycan-binding domain